MKFISIQQALDNGKGTVALRGWVYRERGSNKFKFVVLRDASNIIQCVIDKSVVGEKAFKTADKIQVETSMQLQGTLQQDKRAPTGYELRVKKFTVIGESDKFPIAQNQNPEFLLDMRHLALRNRRTAAILKIRSTVFGAIHEYFRKLSYYEFQSPIITPGGAEEGPTLFELKYYKKKAYLCQTWQLYAEAGVYALEKMYTIAPSFRAEKSQTSRHLTEYWHAEVEATWMNLPELIDLGEGLVKHCFKSVLEKNKKELQIIERDPKILEKVVKNPFKRMTYDQVLAILKKKKMKVEWGKDLRTIEEEKLTENESVPIFVTHYPKEVMAFYKPRDPKNPKTALCFDLIAPERKGEIIGGSERDVNTDELAKSLKAKGEKLEDYKFYFDLCKYGAVPHAGFGMGVERLVRWICGVDNIKDVIAFPRTPTRFSP